MKAAALAVALTLALVARPAFAEEATTQTVEQLTDKAFQQAAAGAYADSIATYLKAYELNKASDILYNVANLYDRKLHERELATVYYRRYIEQPDTNPDLVKKATDRLTSLKHEAEEARRASPQAPAPVAPPVGPRSPPGAASPGPVQPGPERPDPGWRTAGIVIGAVGLAGVLSSLALGAAAKSKNDAASNECGGVWCGTQRGVDDAHDATTFATSATVAAAAGGALLAGGIVLYFVAPRSFAPTTGARWTVTPQVGAGTGTLSLSGSF